MKTVLKHYNSGLRSHSDHNKEMFRVLSDIHLLRVLAYRHVGSVETL
jgi:hypothetical protein